MKEPTIVLSVRVPPKLRERVAILARARGSFRRSDTVGVTVEALTIGLDELERRARVASEASRKGARRG